MWLRRRLPRVSSEADRPSVWEEQYLPRKRRGRITVAAAVTASALAVAVALSGNLYHARASGNPEPTALPPNQPERGMVYTGLQRAPKGDRCFGGFKLADGTCTHGPDAPPPGVDFNAPPKAHAARAQVPSLPSVEQAKTPTDADIAGATGHTFVLTATADSGALPMANGVVCEGDGVSGKRIQVLYLRDGERPSRYAEFLPTLRKDVAKVDGFFSDSAHDTGGERHVRFVTTPECEVDIPEIALPGGGMNDFSTMKDGLAALGYNRSDRLYLIFGDANVYCGISEEPRDFDKGPNNSPNTGPRYSRSDTGCWSDHVAAHELTHSLGAVNPKAPNGSPNGHCNEVEDLMCYEDSGQELVTRCPDPAFHNKLDCGHDDYFNTSPEPGSFLDTNWNVADSEFLIKDHVAQPGPEPAPSDQPPSDGEPNEPPATGDGAAPQELVVSDVTATSVGLSWPAGPEGSQFTLTVNGERYGLEQYTSAHISGLQPATSYTLEMTVNDGTPWTKPVTMQTPAAPDAPDGTFSLTNALTGSTAQFFTGDRGDGSPLLAGRATEATAQQWTLDTVADTGRFRLRSKATGRCAGTAAGKAEPGVPLMQVDCANATQIELRRTRYGTALATTGGLVLGIGKSRYWQQRLMTLQNATDARQQSWTFTAR